MTDDELRTLIREAVARHVGARQPVSLQPAARGLEPARPVPHPSHYQYLALVNVGDACVIEPTVTCNHCGYCRCHGH